MKTKSGFDAHSMAFALASGLVILDDQDGEKLGRKSRWQRRKAAKNFGRRKFSV
jgi:hypothetical protein